MKTIAYWVEHLNLVPHPEGGFYKENYRSVEQISTDALPARYGGTRNYSTAIYFLLRSEDKSVFHRIKSDEIWHFYQGETLLIYVLTEKGLDVLRLGSNLEKGDRLQVVVPANCWFGACVEKSDTFTLAGCTVAPGFDFRDFEMATRDDLKNQFPSQEEIIIKLTH
jgi:predicted cupin superfamily sugar epimerase